MNMDTLTTKFHLQIAKNHWKSGLYVVNFISSLFLIRYGWSLPDRLAIPSWIIVIGLFLYAGTTLVKHLGDSIEVRTYIKDHEGWVFVLLTILLITGTVSYVSWQTSLDFRATANGELNSVSQFTKTAAEQPGLHSSLPPPQPEFQTQPAHSSPANTRALQSSDPPAPGAQAVTKAHLQRNHTAKGNHLLATYSHRPRHRRTHA
jgi:hypothetical protein